MVERAPAGSGAGGAFSDAAFGTPQDDETAKGGVLESVPLPASTPPLDGLRGLSTARFADRQRRDGGGVQDGVHAAFQAFGNALGPGIGPSDFGFACGLSEQHLGRSIRHGNTFADITGTDLCSLANRQRG